MSKQSRILPEQARRAVFFDFEGFADRPPALLGVAVEGELQQVVLDPRLEQAADAKGLQVSSLHEEALKLENLAKNEDRLLVAFTRHELRVCRDFGQVDLEAYYWDAHKAARPWRRVHHPGHAKEPRDLLHYFRLVGLDPPQHHGFKKTTVRLKAVIEQLQHHGEYSRLTSTAKGKWTKVLQHNEHDCLGLADLVMHIAQASA